MIETKFLYKGKNIERFDEGASKDHSMVVELSQGVVVESLGSGFPKAMSDDTFACLYGKLIRDKMDQIEEDYDYTVGYIVEINVTPVVEVE